MNSAPSSARVASPLAPDAAARRCRRKLPWLIAALVVLVVLGAAVLIADPPTSKEAAGRGALDNSYPTAMATVTRQDLISQTQLPAILGYGGSYTVFNATTGTAESSNSGAASSGGTAGGTFTSLPVAGQLINQGDVLYQVNGAPVVLLNGSIPDYRALSEGMTGRDVTELNASLVALGYATSNVLSPTPGYFSAGTFRALEKLQKALAMTETGTLAQGQAVFLPTPIRVTSVMALLGGPAQPGAQVLAATSTVRQVMISLDVSQQAVVKAGDSVAITLPNNHTTPGVVAAVGTVATTASSASSTSGTANATITVLVTPTDPAATGSWDQAPVSVTITSATVRNVFAVPVDALIALSDGGYSVEVVGTHGIHQLVSVALGLFDDAHGLVQVTGSGLAVGQHVVVPGP